MFFEKTAKHKSCLVISMHPLMKKVFESCDLENLKYFYIYPECSRDKLKLAIELPDIKKFMSVLINHLPQGDKHIKNYYKYEKIMNYLLWIDFLLLKRWIN